MERRYKNIIMDINSIEEDKIIELLDQYNFYLIKNTNIRKELNRVINTTGLPLRKSLVLSKDKEVLLTSRAMGFKTCLISKENTQLFDYVFADIKKVNNIKKIIKK